MYEYKAQVVKVYDGDTITVNIDLGFSILFNGQKIRLARINAPELRGSTLEQGRASRDTLRDLVLNKWVIIKTQKDKKGKYGRWLGEVILNGLCINDEMVRLNQANYHDY